MVIKYFKVYHFITPILVLCNCPDKPKVQKLNNVELLKELPFYDELNIVKN